jgi:hypothetical protein
MWPNGSVKKNVLDGLMMMMDSNETWHFIFLSPPSIRKKKGNQRPFCSEMKCQVAPPPVHHHRRHLARWVRVATLAEWEGVVGELVRR